MRLEVCLGTFVFLARASRECLQHFHQNRGDQDGLYITCLCTDAYCDTIEKVGELNVENEGIVYTTTRDGLRLKRSVVRFTATPEKSWPILTVFPSELRQKMMGFGGTFTDGAILNIDNLPERARRHLLESYFGTDGLEYSMGRVPIGSNDFSTRPYSYDDWHGDIRLSNFSLADEDLTHRIPILREVLSLRNGSFRLLATPWTAPFWMKSNGRAQGAGYLLHEVNKVDIWKVYSMYLLRYFEEYLKRGLHFFAVSAQNEPNLSRSPHFPWQAMYFTPEMLVEFVSKYLGPAIKSNKLTKELHILPIEISREQLADYSLVICSNPKAFNLSSGIGIHWYADSKKGVEILRNVVTEWASKYVIYTEAANGWLTNDVVLGDWGRAEKYVDSIMETVNNGVTGWIDYNLCVDMNGGPSWIGNNLDAAIVVDKQNRSFMKQPMFYAIGHFSKFIHEDADYMVSEFTRKGIGVVDISHSSFVNSDGSRVLVLYNRNSTYTWNISIVDNGSPSRALELSLGPLSINTVLWRRISFDLGTKTSNQEPLRDLPRINSGMLDDGDFSNYSKIAQPLETTTADNLASSPFHMTLFVFSIVIGYDLV